MTFKPNYLDSGIRTKEEAFKHIFETVLVSPGCAGNEGVVTFNLWGRMITLKPKKRKEE